MDSSKEVGENMRGRWERNEIVGVEGGYDIMWYALLIFLFIVMIRFPLMIENPD